MKKLLIGLIRLYQRTISVKTPPSCRFTPTCSAYAIEAIERCGVIKGTGLAIWRILRCNPFGKYGYDPVPEKKEKKRGKNAQAPRRRGRVRQGKGESGCSCGKEGAAPVQEEGETPAVPEGGTPGQAETRNRKLPPEE